MLAQVGRELVIYGAGLVAQQHYMLHGPLLFVSASPGAELMLVATLHEKHTKEEHAKLAAFLGPDRLVDEDYDLTASRKPMRRESFSLLPPHSLTGV